MLDCSGFLVFCKLMLNLYKHIGNNASQGQIMKKAITLTAILGIASVATGSTDYEPIISESETDRIMYGLPEGVEIETLPTQLGICGETAAIVMDEHGYRIWCGEYTFMHPALGADECYGNTLERRMLLTDIADKWKDINCDGTIEFYYSGQEGASLSYLDYSTIQMIEGMGMQAEGEILINAARFAEAANMYDMLLFDMNKQKADKLYKAFKARHSQGEE